MNAFEKIIAAVSPGTALRRSYQRYRLQQISEVKNSGYSNYGASHVKKSLLGWLSWGGSHKEDIEDNLDTLRQRSRDLYMGGASLATGALKTLRTNVVGVGLKAKPTIDRKTLNLSADEAINLERQIEKEFSLWADNTACDLQGIDNFAELQQLVFLNWLLSGDVIVLLPTTKRANMPYDLRINLIESDRVSNPNNNEFEKNIIGGIEVNDAGEVIAYHISKHHPHAFLNNSETPEWIKVDAIGKKTGRKNVLHIMNRERIGQLRGVPLLAPVIEDLKQLGRYTSAELMAAVVTGFLTVFIEKENSSNEPAIGEVVPDEFQVDASDKNSIELGNGAIVDLAPGEKANPVNPNRPNTAFDGFVTSMCRQIGAALEIPYEILLKHFSSSYSASRGALLEFWKTVNMYRSWLAADFCQPIYEEWLAEAVAKGRIKAPGFFSDPLIRKAYSGCEWNGPTNGQLDPLKEVNAAEKRVLNGFSNRTKETVELTGGDFYNNIEKLIQEETAIKTVQDIKDGANEK